MGSSNIEVVVARYCEDMSWLSNLPKDWRTIVYDKSMGGPRQGVETQWYKSPDGPNSANIHPGAIPLENVGAEAHTYMTHICSRYDTLAEITVFMQGDPYGHARDVPGDFLTAVKHAEFCGYGAVGGLVGCDNLGAPHHEKPLYELQELFAKFRPGVLIPKMFLWNSSAQFAVKREMIQLIPLDRWIAALSICRTKLHACGMERLWLTLLGNHNARVKGKRPSSKATV